MNIGIVLAGGKGNRFKSSEFNKTTVEFAGKPLVKYGTDLFSQVVDRVLVVVGAYPEGVINSIEKSPKLSFILQKVRLGTGHAVKVAIAEVKKRSWVPDKVWVGYGDHMMFYTPEILIQLGKELEERKAVISMVTCEYENPNGLAWGRIVRSKGGAVLAIVEQKDASEVEKSIKELNAGLYCFRYDFLSHALKKIKKSKISGEYYLTDLVKIAVDERKLIVANKVPFEYVGIGINTPEELKASEKLYMQRNSLQ